MTSTSNFFDIALFLLSGLVTGPSFMSTSSLILKLWQFSFTRIDQKSGNRKYPRLSFWVLPNILRLERVIDTKFGTNVSNIKLLNASKFHGYGFYRFWIVKGKSTGGVGNYPPQPRLGLILNQASSNFLCNSLRLQISSLLIYLHPFLNKRLLTSAFTGFRETLHHWFMQRNLGLMLPGNFLD